MVAGALAIATPAPGASVTGERRAAAIARALANIAAHPDVFAASPNDRFEVRDVIVDPDGREHVRFDRRHKGLRVVGGDLVAHGREDGQLDSSSQELHAVLDVSTQPAVSAADAVAVAAAQFRGTPQGSAVSELIVYARGVVRLAYDVRFHGVQPDGTPSDLHVAVDAQTGAVLDQWDNVQTSAGSDTPTVAATACVGDCDGGGSVTVDELIRGVDIALGTESLAVCPAFDCDGSGTVLVNCLVLGVGYALAGCDAIVTPSSTPTPTPQTPTPSGTGFGVFYGPVPLTTTVNGATYDLVDPSRGQQSTWDLNNDASGEGTLFTDPDNVWGNGQQSSRQSVAVDAQYGMAQTWDYFRLVHGRDGIDNAGTGAINRVHYSTNYDNAFWDASCFCMTYGDGDDVTLYPFAALDIIGHEVTHGVTAYTAALIYSGESGGLNESISDVFGTAVERYTNSPDDSPDYEIGEKLYIDEPEALRYLYRPSKDGASADCWSTDVGTLDVHYSSGVGNHCFYLVAEGSGVGSYTDASGSPTCDGASVAGIGHAAAERIWYRALTVYLTSTASYASARTATLSAATDLYGANSSEYSTVAAAWSAVNVN